MSYLSRRDFLKLSAGAIAAAGAASILDLAFLQEADNIPNPLSHYPDRNWEEVYLDQYHYDSSFTFICGPNDTHLCRLRAFVRNGIVIRTEQNYDAGNCSDLYGNKTTEHWNPRGCLKGMTVHRRLYGPHRAKYPMVRKGWKQWADDGFPALSDDPSLRTRYKFDSRGTDSFVRLTWDEASRYAARGLIAIAETYSGGEGRRRLIEKDGYEPEMLEHWQEAGTRVMKLGSCLPPHGMIGKLGIFRFANMLALVDAHVRSVGPEEAKGARGWSEYTWRGDQAPGMPFVHGLQASDVDFNDLANSRLHIQIGKNLVENKMPESHWFHDLIENGGTIVVISPEYSPPASKADYWIPVRAGLTDTAVLLGITREIIENKWYDEDFVRNFTDFPYLVRLDNLRRLRAGEVFSGYRLGLSEDGPSFKLQGLTAEQYAELGDFVVWDEATQGPKAVTRDEIGDKVASSGVRPAIEGHYEVTLADGKKVEAATVFQMYREHLKDYDLGTVEEISGAPRDLVARLAKDIATKGPVAIHIGEGINHYFHATLANRAFYLPLMLTGNIGKPGAGCHTWAGNYKGAIFQGAPWHGPGASVYRRENPFNPQLDDSAKVESSQIEEYTYEDEPGWWNMGDRPLIVDTPKAGRKVFTGKTHMPSPTKVMWYNNANLLNVAKWHYEMIKNVNPKVDMIIDQQIEWTGSAEYADVILPANSWMEFQDKEIAGSCSNPFLQIWGGGGIEPMYDTRDDAMILAGVAEALGAELEDKRFKDYWKFVLQGRSSVYIQRILDSSITTTGYRVDEIMDGKYGEPGAALFLYRTYPRIAFYEQIKDSLPFYTDTGRLNSYCDLPEAIEYGENLIVHREAVEATPYLPNVIVSTSPYLRPQDYGIPASATGADLRAVRNLMMPWSAVKETRNPLMDQGYAFLCLTPKMRHTVHSSWATVDWNAIWASNFGDPYRKDKRLPGVSDWQLHLNPQAARDLKIEDGDYVWIDASAEDRPYRGWKEDDPFYKVARCMVRVKYNPSYPYNVTMMKHCGWMATERTVEAAETRADGLPLAAETGYQASYRHGSHQSITRGWAPPMHQTDTLFHKRSGAFRFLFGYEDDNHAINTVPKETLIKITRAEAGGIDGQGKWAPATTGFTPGEENEVMKKYLAGAMLRLV